MIGGFREFKLGPDRTNGVAVLAVAVVLAAGLAFTGWQVGRDRQHGGPLLAEGSAQRPGPTVWPTPSGTMSDRAEAGAIAPGPVPESVELSGPTRPASPRPVPMPTGHWAGTATVTVTGQESGCTAVTRTFRPPAILRIEPPLTGDDNVVLVTFATARRTSEGSFVVASSVSDPGSPHPISYWRLRGDGAGGLIGTLSRPEQSPVKAEAAVDNLLYATRGLDEQCGSLLSAPLGFPMGSGSALRVTAAGGHRSVLITGRTSDRTRTFQITFAS